MLDRFQRVGANAKAVALAQRIAQEIDCAKVRQEPVLALIVGMTDSVSDLNRLSCQLATAGHDKLQNAISAHRRPPVALFQGAGATPLAQGVL